MSSENEERFHSTSFTRSLNGQWNKCTDVSCKLASRGASVRVQLSHWLNSVETTVLSVIAVINIDFVWSRSTSNTGFALCLNTESSPVCLCRQVSCLIMEEQCFSVSSYLCGPSPSWSTGRDVVQLWLTAGTAPSSRTLRFLLTWKNTCVLSSHCS